MTSVSTSSWTWRSQTMHLPGKKLHFSFSCSKAAEQRDVRTTATIGPCVPIIFFGSAGLCRFSRGVKVADTAGVEGETNDKVCEMTAPVRIKPDVWKSFGFPVSKNRKEGKVKDALAVMFKDCCLLNKDSSVFFFIGPFYKYGNKCLRP